MKGTIKAIKRTPHMLTSKVGMSSKSSDAEFNDLQRRFTALEDASAKLVKDSTTFRDSLIKLLDSGNGFAVNFATLFSPMGSEYGLESKYPNSVQTIKDCAAYEADMQDLKEAIKPELELIETRIIMPIRDYETLIKKVRKAITKRDHKLVDYDRFNNSYTKLRDKKEKSLNDEKNLFKAEQDFEAATQEYEHYNNLLKDELPRFFELSTALITPLFQSFYFLQLQVMYTMLEKNQAFTGSKYDTTQSVEVTYQEKLGDAAEQIEALAITKRFVSTAKMMSAMRTDRPSPSLASSSARTPPSMSASSSSSKVAPPPSRAAGGAAAPPPYTSSNSAGSVPTLASTKRAPPPIPGKPKPAAQFCTALYDYEAQAEGDLSFSTGDRIEIVQKSESDQDWWTGKINGRQGVFPGNYVQL